MTTGHNLSTRAWSSRAEAERYERARPAYADTAIAFVIHALKLDSNSCVLDLAAGTGKLSRQFQPHVGRVIAVEPLAAMRDALSAAVGGVEVIAGTAEDIPLADDTVDSVVAGQAWHWFDSAKALAEVTRVTRSSGGLALFWNEYDPKSRMMQRVGEIRGEVECDAPSHVKDDWQAPFRSDALWEPLQLRRFPHSVRVTKALFVERVLSSSVMSVLPQPEKSAVSDRLFGIMNEAEGVDSEAVDIPYLTEVFWTSKRS